MKKLLFFVACLGFSMGMFAQVSKTLSLATAGTLLSSLTTTELTTVTNLTLTGYIDARDFKVMRDNMSVLTSIDVSGAIISAYTGMAGTYSTSSMSYPAYTISKKAFYKTASGFNYSLQSFVFSSTTTTIDISAFNACVNLKAITLPSSLTTLADNAFTNCTGIINISLPASITSIGNAVFSGCTALNSVTIVQGVKSIGTFTFNNC